MRPQSAAFYCTAFYNSPLQSKRLKLPDILCRPADCTATAYGAPAQPPVLKGLRPASGDRTTLELADLWNQEGSSCSAAQTDTGVDWLLHGLEHFDQPHITFGTTPGNDQARHGNSCHLLCRQGSATQVADLLKDMQGVRLVLALTSLFKYTCADTISHDNFDIRIVRQVSVERQFAHLRLERSPQRAAW